MLTPNDNFWISSRILNMSGSYPTPVYSHVGRGDFRDVYEPAEDTFLLMDALEKDAERLRKSWWVVECIQKYWLIYCTEAPMQRTAQ